MNFFGLDIGSYKIKIVQLQKVGQGKFHLVAVGAIPSPPRGLSSEAEADLTNVALQIKKLHKGLKINTSNVVCALAEDKVFTRVITVPKLSEDELSSALKYEAEEYIPIPIEEVTLSHQIIGTRQTEKGEKMEVLLVAAPTRLIDKYLKILKAANLNPVSLETEILAMARSLVSPDSDLTLLADLGASATDIAIVDHGLVIFSRSIQAAGEALTQAVATSFGMESSQAEEYKKAYGLDVAKLEGKVGQAITPVLEVVIKEMEQAIRFCQQEKGGTVKRILLTGGTAILPEVITQITKRLSVETQVGDPFARVVQDSLLAKLPKEDLSFYTVAVGLAMKEV